MQPASFQDVTPGPKSSYGTTSMPPDPGRYRSQVAWWHHYRDAIEEQGAKVGVRNPVALLVGTCALVLLVLIASLKPAATLKTALELDTDGFIDPSMSLDGSELHLQQLPCWTGSCDNYLFEDAAQLLDDATCDDLADGFGCNECKREDDMPDPLVPYASEGRVVLCPRSPVGIQIGDYVAVPAKEYPQALGMLHLPTVRDCTSYYLLQGDNQGLLKQEAVCSFWASTFGCANHRCNSTAEVAASKELKDFVDAEGLLHPDSRVLKCGKTPAAGERRTASGIEYSVREWAKPAAKNATAAAPNPQW